MRAALNSGKYILCVFSLGLEEHLRHLCKEKVLIWTIGHICTERWAGTRYYSQVSFRWFDIYKPILSRIPKRGSTMYIKR
jgi:hypothetical protein